MAACIDLSYTFDPDYAARCGAHPGKLLLVRPHDEQETLENLYKLIASRGIGVLVLPNSNVDHCPGPPGHDA